MSDAIVWMCECICYMTKKGKSSACDLGARYSAAPGPSSMSVLISAYCYAIWWPKIVPCQTRGVNNLIFVLYIGPSGAMCVCVFVCVVPLIYVTENRTIGASRKASHSEIAGNNNLVIIKNHNHFICVNTACELCFWHVCVHMKLVWA